MGQKIRPTGFRLGIVENWKSKWYANKKDFGKYLVQDQKIRRYLRKQLESAGLSRIDIARTPDKLDLRLTAARPAFVIGRKGAKVNKLRDELTKMTGKETDIKILEVKKPELDATLVAQRVAEQLLRRSSFRRTVKRAVEETMNAGALGCKVMVSGRLGGAEMARREYTHDGSIPLNTLRAKIDYGFHEAKTNYGVIGVKAWVYTGLLTEEEAG